MELSRDVLEGITLAGNASDISDELFKFLHSQIFKPMTKNKNQDIKDELEERVNGKIAFISLHQLLSEANKHDVDVSTLSAVLEECKWNSSRITSFTNLYRERKERIQAELSLIGKATKHIVDVKWRQEYVIKSRDCESMCELSYLITLKTWDPQLKDTDELIFAVTVDKLQDLVLKLKDATKCIERNAV